MKRDIPDRSRRLENALYALRTHWAVDNDADMDTLAEQAAYTLLAGTMFKWEKPKKVTSVFVKYGKSSDTTLQSLGDDATGLWEELRPYIKGIKGIADTHVKLQSKAEDVSKVLDYVHGKRYKGKNNQYYVDVTKSKHIVWKQKDLVWDGATWRNADEEVMENLFLTAYIEAVGSEPSTSSLRKTISMAHTRGRPAAADNPRCRDWYGSINLISGKRLVGARFSNGILQLIRPTQDTDDWTAEFVPDSKGNKPDKSVYWVAPNDYDYVHLDWDGATYDSLLDKLALVAPKFAKFLEHVTSYETDPVHNMNLKIRYMQMLGQMVARDNRHQKMWCMIGTGGTGKSVTQNLAIELVGGLDNVDGGTFKSLAEEISVLNLIGKAVVVVTELTTRPHSGIAANSWDQAWHNSKAITGGDAVKLRKFFKDITGAVRLHANYLMAGNEMPSFSRYRNDASAAARRLMPFVFKVAATKEDDMLVHNITEDELGFIASAAFQIYTCPQGAWFTGNYCDTPANEQLLQRAVTSDWQPLLDLFAEADSDSRISSKAVNLLARYVRDWSDGDVKKNRHRLQKAMKDYFNMDISLPRTTGYCEVLDESVNGAWFHGIKCVNLDECQEMIVQQLSENTGENLPKEEHF